MLEFKRTMDPHSLDIVRDGKFVGFLQWHSDREKRVVFQTGQFITLSEMKQCVEKLDSNK